MPTMKGYKLCKECGQPMLKKGQTRKHPDDYRHATGCPLEVDMKNRVPSEDYPGWHWTCAKPQRDYAHWIPEGVFRRLKGGKLYYKSRVYESRLDAEKALAEAKEHS